MIRSMTGYGWAEDRCSSGSVRAEVHTVNYKIFKFTPHLPDFLRYQEGELQKLAKKTVKRGHLHLTADANLSDDTIGRLLDRDTLIAYIDAIRGAVPDDMTCTAEISGLIGLPGVMKLDSLPDDMREEMFECLSSALGKALGNLDAMRQAEGKGMQEHFFSLCNSVEKKLEDLSLAMPKAVRAYQKRLKEKIDELLQNSEISADSRALSSEVAIMAERCDVAEELQRLGNHLQQFRKVLKGEERGGGKKLEFLTQEMHREANTLGSKLLSAELVHGALDIKSEIHQLREQVMNVE